MTQVPDQAQPVTPRRRVPGWVIGGVLIVIGTIGLIGTVWVVKRYHARSATRAVQQAAAAAEVGRYDEAFSLLAAACEAQPNYPEYAKRAALAAVGAGRVPEAVSYGRRAWDAGLRDEEVLGAMLAGETGANAGEEGMSRVEALISALDQQPARLRMRARVLTAYGRIDEARKALSDLIALEPTSVAVSALAELMMRQGNGGEALTLLETHRAAGRLDASGYRLLALARSEADLANPDPLQHGAVLEIINEARKRGQIDDALRFDESLYRIIAYDLNGALSVLSEITTGRNDAEARLLEALVMASLGRAGEWQPPKNQRIGGAAGEALALIANAMSGTSPEDGIFSLQKAERLIGERPALHLLIARLMVARGERESALQRYRSVRGLLAYAPVVLLEQAEVLAVLGQRDAAVSLILAVHRLHGPTKRSLLLFDALVGGSVGSDVIEAMRRLAATQGGDQQMAALAKDLARRQQSSASPAEEALNPTARAVANAVRTRLFKREFGPALADAEASQLPPAVREAFRGFALQGLGRHAEALQAFAAARVENQPAYLHLCEALSALALKNTAITIAAVERAQETLPNDPMAWQVLISALVQDRRGAEAVARLNAPAAVALDPVQRDALLAMSLASNGESDAALEKCLAVLKVQPRHVLALPFAIDLHLAAGRSEEALTLLLPVDMQADPSLLLRRMTAHMSRNDHRAALADLDLLPPDYQAAMQGNQLRIRLLIAIEDLREAQRALDALPEDTPAPRRAVLGALVQERAGRRPAALFLLRPFLHDGEAAGTWARLALAEDAQAAIAEPLASARLPAPILRRISALVAGYERWTEALALVEQARVLTPDDPLVLNDWAWYSAQAGHALGPAIDAALRSVSLLANHPVPLDTTAVLLIRADRAPEAVELLDAHRDTVSQVPQLAYDRALALARCGKVAESISGYQAIIEAIPTGGAWPLRESRETVAAELAALKKHAAQ